MEIFASLNIRPCCAFLSSSRFISRSFSRFAHPTDSSIFACFYRRCGEQPTQKIFHACQSSHFTEQEERKTYRNTRENRKKKKNEQLQQKKKKMTIATRRFSQLHQRRERSTVETLMMTTRLLLLVEEALQGTFDCNHPTVRDMHTDTLSKKKFKSDHAHEHNEERFHLLGLTRITNECISFLFFSFFLYFSKKETVLISFLFYIQL